MKWLRLYHDTVTDPKWRVVSNESGQPVGNVLAVWMEMLINASGSSERGTLEGWQDRYVAANLGYPTDAVRAIRDAMQGVVLDGDRLTGWDKRQKATDDAAVRVREYRDRLHAGTGRKSAPYVAAEIITRDGAACVYCGATAKLCVDHLVPVVCGGDHEPDNLACSCKKCNSGKAGRTPEQAGYRIINAEVHARYLGALARMKINPVTVAPGEPQGLTARSTDVTVTDHPDTVTVTEKHLSLSLTNTPVSCEREEGGGGDAGAPAREVGIVVAGLTGLPATPRNVAAVKEWLAAGYDPQQDIYPAVVEALPTAPGAIGSFRYFTKAIARHHAARTAPQPEKVASNVHHLRSPAGQHRGNPGRATGGTAAVRVLARELEADDLDADGSGVWPG